MGTPPSVLWLTVLLLFGPKLMGTIWVLADGTRRRSFGGFGGVLRSVALEVPLAILLAPVTMVMQVKALFGLALGIPAHWNTQERDARRISVREVLPDLKEHIALGLVFAATAFIDPVTALWLSPLTLGLLASPWLISLTSSQQLGERAERHGCFAVPASTIDDPVEHANDDIQEGGTPPLVIG